MIMQTELWKRLRERLNPIPTGHAILGLSGGADSVALLLLLLPEKESGRLNLEAIHVNHGLRGYMSDDDMNFTRQLCEAKGIPWHGYTPDLHGKDDENSAREARYKCFRECLQTTGAESLILAHHKDDQAETYMIRLMRGAGPEGLGCMRRDTVFEGIRIIRPMLDLRRDEIRRMLKENGIPWREDLSNQDPRYLRNRIRLEILPEIERACPGAINHISAAAEITDLENRAMDELSQRLINEYAGEDWFLLKGLADQPEAIRIRTLRKWWKQYIPGLQEHTLNREQSNMLNMLTEAPKGTRINLPGETGAIRGARHLHLTGKSHPSPATVHLNGSYFTFGDITLTIREDNGETGDGVRCQCIPEAMLQGCVIRTRRDGDRISPYGSGHSRKLQDYLTDRKVDVSWRDRIPLLCNQDEVLMVCGIGTGKIPPMDYKVSNRMLVWSGPMPWIDE